MPAILNPTSQIKAKLGLEPNGRVQRAFTHSCRVHMDKYLPFDTGTLAKTVTEEPKAVIYNQQYSNVVYYGIRNGKALNYQLDKHPLAGPYWDRRMVSAEIETVVDEVRKYVGGKK